MIAATAEYETLEARLIELLDEALEDIDVMAYPESDTLPHVKRSGMLIVGDAGDTVGDPIGRYLGGGLPQAGTYSFSLDLYVKNLRGPHGVRSVIRQIRDAISGQRAAAPPSPLSMTRYVYRGARPVSKNEASKVWNYEITIDANYKLYSP